MITAHLKVFSFLKMTINEGIHYMAYTRNPYDNFRGISMTKENTKKYVEEHSLAKGMSEFVPLYKLLKKIPFIANLSNKIIVLRK